MPVARFDLLRIRYLICKLVWIAITCVHLHPTAMHHSFSSNFDPLIPTKPVVNTPRII